MHEIRIVAFLSAILISAFQTLRASRCPFSASGLGAPLALVALVLYRLGMATGGNCGR
jgi:hypothetical protein